MTDDEPDFCVVHGYDHIVHPKLWSTVPYCAKCAEELQRKYNWQPASKFTVKNWKHGAVS